MIVVNRNFNKKLIVQLNIITKMLDQIINITIV